MGSSSSGYAITITAVDGASKNIDVINRKLANLRAPGERLQKQFAKFGDLSGLTAVKKGFEGVAGSALTMAKAIEPLGIITGAASLGGLYALATRWGQLGTQLNFTSHWTGVAADKLQALSVASVLAGSSSEALTSGMESLSRTVFDAIGGGNSQAVGAFNALGVSFQDAGRHAIATDKVFDQLNRTISAIKNPQAQQYWARMVGAESLLPLLIRRPEDNQKDLDAARKFNLLNQYNINGAIEFRKSLDNAGFAATGLGNALAGLAAPYLENANDYVARISDRFNTILGIVTEARYLEERREKLSPAKAKELHNIEEHRALRAATAAALQGDYFPAPIAPGGGVSANKYIHLIPGGGSSGGSATNNPTNLAYVPGQPGVIGRHGRWGVYPTEEAGIAAGYRQMLLDHDRGYDTIAKEITRRSPPGENDTAGMIRDISAWSHINPNAPLDLRNPDIARRFLAADIRREGNAVDTGTLNAGIQSGLELSARDARTGGDAGGRVVVDTHVKITDTRTQVISSAKGSGNVSPSAPKVMTTTVGTSPG